MDNVIKIDQEEIEYSGIDKVKNKFTGLKRGANKTIPARHVLHQTVFQLAPTAKGENSHAAFSFLLDAIDDKITEISVESVEGFRPVGGASGRQTLPSAAAKGPEVSPKPVVK